MSAAIDLDENKKAAVFGSLMIGYIVLAVKSLLSFLIHV
jgi:hypothetical protein